VANLLTRPEAGLFELSADAAQPGLVGFVMLTTLIAGVAFVAIIVASQTIIQERVPSAVRGRVFAVQLMLSNVVSILPLVGLGGLADVIGVGRTLVLLGFAILGTALLTIRQHRAFASAAESDSGIRAAPA
jgi:hypothetical protein